jgi:hypothetical protein
MAAGLAVHYSKMREDGAARVRSWRQEGDREVDIRECAGRTVDPDALRAAELAIAGADCLKRMRQRADKGTAHRRTTES